MTISRSHASPVLVLDANQRSALAATRSLGRHAEVQVITADDSTRSLAGSSRFASKYLRYPSPLADPAGFVDWLVHIIRAEGIRHVYPMTEITSFLCLMNRDRFGACKLPFASHDTVMMLADKWRLVQLADQLGIPHPKSQWFANGESFQPPPGSAFPLVLKPTFSRIFLGDRWLNSGVHVANSHDETARLTAEQPYLRHHPFMAQSFIPGSGAGIFALYNQGQAVTFFAHRRVREKPPGGGVSVLSESIAPPPDMLAMAKALLDAANWHGVAMVEFRVTPQGEPYLMEVNTRFWGSLQLAIDAGVDFPYLLHRITAGEPLPEPSDYRTGRRLRWLLGDLDSLYLTLRDPSQFSGRQKCRRLLDFITPHPFMTRHEVNRLNDLGPAWHELLAYWRALRHHS